MIITTGDSTSSSVIEHARQLAEELNCRFIDRRKQSLPQLARRYKDDQFLVFLSDRTRYVWIGNTDLTYHPSMAFVRAKRLLEGETDTMITASRAEAGDHVLDCTAGLGSDSLVFAVVTGEGMQRYESDMPLIDAAMRRVEMVHMPHQQLLKQLPDRSQDIVYFDPMFRNTVEASAHMDPLRHMANHEPLSKETIAEACRVARKTVVMKELRDSSEFERLGFSQIIRTNNSKLAYGVITIGNDNES